MALIAERHPGEDTFVQQRTVAVVEPDAVRVQIRVGGDTAVSSVSVAGRCLSAANAAAGTPENSPGFTQHREQADRAPVYAAKRVVHRTKETTMKTLTHGCTAALAAVVLAVAVAPADAHGYGRGGYRGGHGPGWGAVGIGLGLGVGLGWLAGSRHGYTRHSYGPPVYSSVIVPAYPSYGYVYAEPPSVVYREVPVPVYREVPRQEPVAKAPPEPIIYPRNGQNAQQIEADRQDCNRWATTQPSAMADSSVFNRATDACMDGRGYTLR